MLGVATCKQLRTCLPEISKSKINKNETKEWKREKDENRRQIRDKIVEIAT